MARGLIQKTKNHYVKDWQAQFYQKHIKMDISWFVFFITFFVNIWMGCLGYQFLLWSFIFPLSTYIPTHTHKWGCHTWVSNQMADTNFILQLGNQRFYWDIKSSHTAYHTRTVPSPPSPILYIFSSLAQSSKNCSCLPYFHFEI